MLVRDQFDFISSRNSTLSTSLSNRTITEFKLKTRFLSRSQKIESMSFVVEFVGLFNRWINIFIRINLTFVFAFFGRIIWNSKSINMSVSSWKNLNEKWMKFTGKKRALANRPRSNVESLPACCFRQMGNSWITFVRTVEQFWPSFAADFSFSNRKNRERE